MSSILTKTKLLFFKIGLGMCGLIMGMDTAWSASSAVVLMYHRFGENQYPSTNIRISQFEAHLSILTSGEFSVKSLTEITAALRNGNPLPDKTVGISIDDAFLSVYQKAWPRLREAKLPFTLFIATDPIDKNLPGYMSWNQIRTLQKAGVEIGNQTASHPHMPLLTTSRIEEELTRSSKRFQEELGFVPKTIAYPYGEYSLAVGKTVRAAGFTIGFGQHSGVLHSDSDFFYLPRFAFNETFGGVNRLKLASRALPLRAVDITPADPFLTPSLNPPAFGFTLTGKKIKKLNPINCYAPNGARLRIERLGESRIEVRMDKKFSAGRSRINCTVLDGGGRWRWFGRQFFVPK